jgi:pimeloyl-ACP methyl ester carboxylesterase
MNSLRTFVIALVVFFLFVCASSASMRLISDVGSNSGQANPYQPLRKELSVNGTTINYWEQGVGLPVIFVHGAISDHRYWEFQHKAVAERYRFIALDRRYFGTAPWSDAGTNFSQATHVADLSEFIRQLRVQRAFVVGTSGGASIALVMALHHPELVRGLFINEPGLRSILTPADQKLVEGSDKGRNSAVAAAKAGNMTEAAKLFVNFANGDPDSFDKLPPSLKTMVVDNARTLVLSPPPPEPITCAELGQLKLPITITQGQLTKPASRVLADAVHRCIPGSQLVVIPNTRHSAPRQNPSAFNEALLAFIAQH